METRIVSVAKDFSLYPGLRHSSASDESGEDFYHDVLNNEFKLALEEKKCLVVDLDGTDGGYASSFIDEAFGRLVYDFTLANVKKYLKVTSDIEPHWLKMLETETYTDWEKRRKKNDAPTITRVNNSKWFVFRNNSIETINTYD